MLLRIKRNTEHLLVLSLFLLITLFLYRNFFSDGVIAGLDIFKPIATVEYLTYNEYPFQIWGDKHFGRISILTLYSFLAVINKFIYNSNIVFKFLYGGATFFGMTLMYFLLWKLTKNKLSGALAGIIYSTNHWIVRRIAIGHTLHVFAYTLTPILFYLIHRYMKKGKAYNLFIFSIVYSLLILTRIDPILYSMPLFIYPIFELIFNSDLHFRVIKFRIIKFYLGSFFLVFLCSIYFWLPPLMGVRPINLISFSVEEIGKTSLGLTNSWLGFSRALSYTFSIGYESWNTHPFLSEGIYKGVASIFPLIAFSSLIFSRKKIVYYFSFIAVVAIFIAKGPYPPFEFLFDYFYHNFPIISHLRTPPRWSSIIWFSYTLMIGITISEICNKFLNNKKKMSLIIIGTLLLSSLFLTSPYIFKNGYQVWSMPKEAEAYTELNEHFGGIYRTVSVPYAQNRMYNYRGNMEHDLGHDSYYFSKHPTLGRSGTYKDKVSNFVKYTEYLVQNGDSKKIGKILGIYDFKYIVLHSYPPTAHYKIKTKFTYQEHEFFKNQEGLKKLFQIDSPNYEIKVMEKGPDIFAFEGEKPSFKIIHSNRDIEVFENKYWIPRFFIPTNQMVIVGGLESFLYLAELRSFDFEDWNLHFADELRQEGGQRLLEKYINSTDIILFVNTAKIDLTMLLQEPKQFTNVENDGWFEDDQPINEGFFIHNQNVMSSIEHEATISYIYDVDKDSDYEVWVRMLMHNQGGNVTMQIDNIPIGTITTNYEENAFRWLKVNEVKMNKGKHELKMYNEFGKNTFDQIAIYETGVVQNFIDRIDQVIDKKTMYLLDIEKVDVNEEWGEKNIIVYNASKPVDEFSLPTKARARVSDTFSFDKISPSKWILEIDTDSSYTLIFSSSYHNMWSAYVEDREYRSIPSYYFINSFEINETGPHKVRIEFVGQKIQNIGLIASAIIYTACIAYIIYDWKLKIILKKYTR